MIFKHIFRKTPIKFKRLTIVFAILFLGMSAFAQENLSKDSSTIFLNDSTTLFTKVDRQPKFPGEPGNWSRFLVKTMRYPIEAQDNEIMGITRISFIVNVDGTLSDIRAVEGDPILAKESVRVIKASGNWEPAVYKGEKVKAYHVQPLVYKLETVGEPRRRKNR